MRQIELVARYNVLWYVKLIAFGHGVLYHLIFG
jgi:hypothetical protein